MYSVFKVAIVGALASMLPAVAMAQTPMMSPVPAMNWAGFYGGIHGGFATGTPQSCVTTNDFVGLFGPYTCAMWTGEPSVGGGYFGGQLGYNWLLGNNVMLGVEGDISAAGISGSGTEKFTPGPTITATGSYAIDWLGTIRGRLGYVMGDWMPYVTAGAAFAGASRTTNVVGSPAVTASADHSGWTVGVGAEWAFMPMWTLKGEYKYIDLGASTYSYPSIVGTKMSIDHKLHTFELGLNRKF